MIVAAVGGVESLGVVVVMGRLEFEVVVVVGQRPELVVVVVERPELEVVERRELVECLE